MLYAVPCLSPKARHCTILFAASPQVMRNSRDSVTSVAVTERAEILAGSVDGAVRRFDVRMGRLFTDELHHPVTCVKGADAAGGLLLFDYAYAVWGGWLATDGVRRRMLCVKGGWAGGI